MSFRYYLVEKAKDANIVGILVGTLGVGTLFLLDSLQLSWPCALKSNDIVDVGNSGLGWYELYVE